MTAADIAVALGRAVRVGHDWRCDCPVHQGHSLTIADGRDGILLVKCFGGCEWREIFGELRALGLIEGRPVDINPEREDELRRRREAQAKAHVKIGLLRDGYYQLLDGLQAGELVATEGSLFLSNALAIAAR